MHEVFDRFPTTNLASHSDSAGKKRNRRRETAKPAETSERDTTKISAPVVGVKRQLLPVLKLHVVLSPKKWPVRGWVRFVYALVLVFFWYSAWTCLGPVNKPY